MRISTVWKFVLIVCVLSILVCPVIHASSVHSSSVFGEYGITPEGYAQVMFDSGYNLYQRGELKRAVEFFTEAVSAWPEFSKAWEWLARTYQETGRYRNAIVAWDRVLQLDPGYEPARYFKRAVQKWNQYGKSAWQEYEAGHVAYGEGNFFEAAYHFRQAISENPSFDLPYYWLGVTSLQLGDALNAEWALERFLALNPGNPEGEYWLREARRKIQSLQR